MTSWAPVLALRMPGMKPHAAPNAAPSEQGQRKVKERREVRQREPGQGRPGGAEYDLPLSADVEEAGAKGESYPSPAIMRGVVETIVSESGPKAMEKSAALPLRKAMARSAGLPIDPTKSEP